jgi:hypothetical protein
MFPFKPFSSGSTDGEAETRGEDGFPGKTCDVRSSGGETGLMIQVAPAERKKRRPRTSGEEDIVEKSPSDTLTTTTCPLP